MRLSSGCVTATGPPPSLPAKANSMLPSDAALIGIQLHCNLARASFRIAQLEPAIPLILDIEDPSVSGEPRQYRGVQHEQLRFAIVHTLGVNTQRCILSGVNSY